jgi:hypothetical protein
MDGGSFTGDFERMVIFFSQGMCKTRLWKRASLTIGEPGGRGNFAGDSERQTEGSGNGVYLSMGAPLGEPGGGALLYFDRQMEGSGNGVSICMGAL